MCMVRGGGDILFPAINTSGAVRKKWEGGFCFYGGVRRRGVLFSDTESRQTFDHASLTYIWGVFRH